MSRRFQFPARIVRVLVLLVMGPLLGVVPFLGAQAAVTVSNFNAAWNADHVRIVWTTVSETDNVGFNLLRSTSKNDGYTQINSALIPSQCLGCLEGANYSYDDGGVGSNQTVYYKLESVDIHQAKDNYGPVSVQVPDLQPTAQPTNIPTAEPTGTNTPLAATPTRKPTATATAKPTKTKTRTLTPAPGTTLPTATSTLVHTATPTVRPSGTPDMLLSSESDPAAPTAAPKTQKRAVTARASATPASSDTLNVPDNSNGSRNGATDSGVPTSAVEQPTQVALRAAATRSAPKPQNSTKKTTAQSASGAPFSQRVVNLLVVSVSLGAICMGLLGVGLLLVAIFLYVRRPYRRSYY